ncbi:MAG TPA: AMIN domain-containing protein [Candidatus Goldiibacteriota bacterium]|nr:AMIN domain-containing protein [Candidatus Goldiibacteriota bacterium]
MNNKQVLLALFFISMLFVAGLPALSAEDEEFISVSPVEKAETSSAMEAGAVKAVPAAVKPAVKGAAIDGINSSETDAKVKVTVNVSDKVKYKATELSSPARILLQLENTSTKSDTIKVDKGAVGKVRLAPHDSTAWVVIDLNEGKKWQAGVQGNSIFVEVEKGASAAPKADAEAEIRKPSGMIYRVVDVAASEQDSKVRVIITTDGPAKYRMKKDSKNKSLRLDVVDAVSSVVSSSVAVNKGTVKSIGITENKKSKEVGINMNLSKDSPYTVVRDHNQIIVDVEKGEEEAQAKNKNLNLRQKLSINVQNASLPGVLRMLASQTGFEFITSQSVALAAPVTMKEDDQPLSVILRDLLVPQNLYYEVRGDMIKIGSPVEIKTEKAMLPKVTRHYSPRTMKDTDLLKILQKQVASNPMLDVIIDEDSSPGMNKILVNGTRYDIDTVMDMIARIDVSDGNSEEYSSGIVTKIFKLKNIRLMTRAGDTLEGDTITELKNIITQTLESDDEASVNFDLRTSSIVVTASQTYMKRVEKIIESLDVRVPQVIIEAKLYEVNVNNIKDLGVAWDASSQNTEPYIKGEMIPLAVNPAGKLTLGTILSGFKINAYLNALEQKNEAKLLSAPKIAVQSDREAVIETMRRTYYEVQNIVTNANSAPIITTEYKNLDLPISLRVVPKINNKNEIDMNVTVKVVKLVGTTSTSAGPPDTSEQEATTYVKASNNDTLVIGGLMSERIYDTVEKVPLLGDIPLLGELFKSTKKSAEKVELIVFLTPSIVED